jgi:DNA (cytosine-5)-methyltransferase 1
MTTKMSRLRGMSLFSGMGGDTLGMKNAGIHVEAYSELVETFRKTHEQNFPECEVLGEKVNSDILKIPDEEFNVYRDKIDILFAGFPCQSFSTGGKRKMNDPRNTMFKEFVRVAKCTNAKIVIGENVKGLLTKKTETGELYIDVIVSEFKQLGYQVIYKVFPCHKYGIPQKRERLIILGIKTKFVEDGTFKLSFPEEDTPTKEEFVNLEHIVDFTMEGTMSVTNEDFDFDTIPKKCILTNKKNDENEQHPHPYLVMKRDIENKTYKGKTYKSLFSFAKRDSPIHCEIVDIRKPSKTIICTYDHQPRLFVPIRNKKGDFLRMFTGDELKQIQTFPKDFVLCGNQKQKIVQCGNAVPPVLIEKIVKCIIG